MATLINLLKLTAIMTAAVILGNMFHTEIKKARSLGAPWYAPYLSLPGILIILAIMIPFIIWVLKKG